jgi:hypothetical protein
MLLGLLVGALALQAWAWIRLSARVKSGHLGLGQAIARYAGWALIPVAGVGVVFFTLVGLEEWTGSALVPESVARATPLVALLLLVLFIAGSFAFVVWCVYLRTSTGVDRRS